jgi:predicted hotdog family 3-hydroxylacyl-ACP dehydratase
VPIHPQSLHRRKFIVQDAVMEFMVEQFIPHRGKMKLVDEIVSICENEVLTRTTATHNWPLLPGGFADPVMLVEVVAQSAGIHNEWLEMQKNTSRKPSGGWLVGIRDMSLSITEIRVGAIIVTRTQNTYTVKDFREITGQSTIDGDLIATVRLQIIQA